MIKIAKNYTFLRLPKVSSHFFTDIIQNDLPTINKLLQDSKYDFLFEYLEETNPFLFKQRQKLEKKHTISILNYLMRMSCRTSPYKNTAGIVFINNGEKTQIFENKIQSKEIKEIEPSFIKKQSIKYPLLHLNDTTFIFNNNHLAKITDLQTSQKSELLSKLRKKSLSNTLKFFPHLKSTSYNAEDYFDLNHKRTNLQFYIKSTEFSEKELIQLSKEISKLLFLNGECGTKSFTWLEKIRKYLFENYGPRPLKLINAISLIDIFRNSNDLNALETQSYITPFRHELRSIIQKGLIKAQTELNLQEEDIQSLKAVSKEFPTDISKDYNVIFQKIHHEESYFVRFCRASYRGVRLLSQYIENSQKLIPPSKIEGVIFADIVKDNDVDNPIIQRRPKSTDYIINLNENSSITGLTNIDLDDLYIYASNIEIVLFSKSLNKRVIPVLTVSYIAEQDSNPYYRFLATLAKRHFSKGITLDLLWMELNYYPRIKYKNLILFPQTWIFSKKQLITLLEDKVDLKLPEFVRVMDQMKDALVYTKNDYFLEFIAKCKDEKVVIQEDYGNKSLITAETGNWTNEISYTFSLESQKKFNLPFIHYQDQYQENSSIQEINFFMPNEALVPFTRFLLNSKLLESVRYYFIYYQYPHSHLRLRVFESIEIAQKIRDQFFIHLKDDYLISNATLKPYEIERTQYINEIGHKIYLETSIYLSTRYKKLSYDLEKLISPMSSSWGPSMIVIYLGTLFLDLAEYFSLEISDFKLDTAQEFRDFKKLQEWFKKNKDCICKIEQYKEDYNFLIEQSHKWKVEAQGNTNKDISFFINRMIHMEVFRLTTGIYPKTNRAVLIFAKYLKTQRHFQK